MIKKFLTGSAMVAAAVAVWAASPTDAHAGGHGVAPKCDTAKLIVPWKAGGGTAIIFNLFEKTIREHAPKTNVKVLTVPGQGGNKGAKEAARAKPDGCTLFAIHQSAITSYLNGRIGYHYDNFDTVALLTSTPDIIGASKDVPFDDFAGFMKAAKAAPGSMKTGATFGSTSQFMWLILEDLTGMKFDYVPYDGTAQRMTALLSGAIQLGTLNVASGRKHLESGALKGFAIAADERSKHMPNMPTLKELGVDMTYSLKRGIVVPKGTPKDYVMYWTKVFKKAAEDPKLMEALDAKGTDVQWVGPEEYREWANKTFEDHKKVAIKIGLYKPQ